MLGERGDGGSLADSSPALAVGCRGGWEQGTPGAPESMVLWRRSQDAALMLFSP